MGLTNAKLWLLLTLSSEVIVDLRSRGSQAVWPGQPTVCWRYLDGHCG
jgi:hypothetical protein